MVAWLEGAEFEGLCGFEGEVWEGGDGVVWVEIVLGVGFLRGLLGVGVRYWEVMGEGVSTVETGLEYHVWILLKMHQLTLSSIRIHGKCALMESSCCIMLSLILFD